MDVAPNLPKCPVQVLMSYRTYRRVRYRYESLYRYRRYRYPCRTEHTEVTTTVMDVPKLPKCPVPVLMSYRTYRSDHYRYGCTELTEVSGTGIEVVPNLPKCPVPVIPAIYIGGMPRYVPYRTQPSLYAAQKVPFGLSTEYKSER